MISRLRAPSGNVFDCLILLVCFEMVEYHMPAAYESVLLFLGRTNLAFPIPHGSPRRKEVRWNIFPSNGIFC